MTDTRFGEGSWVLQAACRYMNPEVFFPEKVDEEGPAREICAGCPVIETCLKDALDQPGDVEGIWGGTNKRQRKRIRAGGTGKRPTAASGNAAVNAAKTHCKRNHEYTPENTRWSKGTRSCRACYDLVLEKRRAATAARRLAVAA